jgi:hypothetical protein
MRLTNFLTTTCLGELSGSPSLVTTRTFRAIPNRRLPGAASRGRDESAEREMAFLSNEMNGEDQVWLATLHLNCFCLAAATTSDNGSRGLPPATAYRYIIVANGGIG